MMYSIYIQQTIAHTFDIEADSIIEAIKTARAELTKTHTVTDEIIIQAIERAEDGSTNDK